MANLADKYDSNVNGKFYVDNQCIDCDNCQRVAPEHFTRNPDGYAIVFKQPTIDIEIELCNVAKNECPVEAIGSDGN